MSFVRFKEDFVCEHCGHEVHGNGYTNHCPQCLWSKHVDIEPGDRAESCGGLMEPVGIELRGKDTLVQQRCTLCGRMWKNKIDAEDNQELVRKLSVMPPPGFFTVDKKASSEKKKNRK